MRGIPEERLKVIAAMPASVFEAPASEIINYLIAKECHELQEPWMTLDEFLKSGFVGLCWVEFPREPIIDAYFDGDFFRHSSTSGFIHNENYILRVQPIHKPEPPR